MSWDPFQREVLAELGHVLYRAAPAIGPAQEPRAVERVAIAKLKRALEKR